MIRMLPNANSNLEEFYPFADVDFIVSDIDGTLISGSEAVFKQIKGAIKKLKQQKVYVTVATGRTLLGASVLLKELDIKTGMPIVLYNGSVVLEYGTENIVFIRYIKKEAIENLLSILSAEKFTVFLYSFDVCRKVFRVDGETEISEKVYGIGAKNREYDVNGLRIQWIGGMDDITIPINTILIEQKNVSSGDKKRVLDFLESNGDLSYTDSGSGYIEVKSRGTSKNIIFSALRQLTMYSEKSILAIGDNDNDIELFQSADIAVAVGNSSVNAIEEADYICDKDSTKGFLDMLNVIKEARKYWREKGK